MSDDHVRGKYQGKAGKALWYREERERLRNDPVYRAKRKRWLHDAWKRAMADPKKKAAVYARRRTWRMVVKQEFVDAYGGCCACCRETRLPFLTVEHKNGDGAEHRRRTRGHGGIATYLDLKRMGFPQGPYEVLCFNCNHARYYGGCPHVAGK